ncbi:Protein PEA2 [Nakaseomyces bracarensis]|uniref:Protein PEA2 n=1 Tax=Nakaseomyces bracarensis TaxID=273131 RepID=A0ABR4NZL6_9SACH
MIDSKYDMDLLRRANPVLFSPQRYDEYPLGYDDLMQYLSTKDITSSSDPQHNRPYTYIDSLDFLLYGQGDGDLDIDLDKKLACEYALYYVQSKKKSKRNKRRSMLGSKLYLDELLNNGGTQTRDWYEAMVSVLESVSITELEPELLLKLDRLTQQHNQGNGRSGSNHHHNNQLTTHNISVFNRPDFGRNGVRNSGLELLKDSNLSHSEVFSGKTLNESDESMDDETNEVIQDLTSYLISNSIKRGIKVKPTNLDNPVQFLKNAIDEILNTRGTESPALDRSSNIDMEHSASPVNNADAIDTQELETALKDLQLAHSFLTKQFEHSRAEQSQTIGKLTKTNRELQDKLLKYHSKISKLEDKLRESETKKRALEDEISKSNAENNLSISSPIIAPELFTPASPSSPGSNNSHSITVMRNEFKRMIIETQKKYEKELSEEREKRQRLELELDELKD